jgi:hypothetical protein
MIQLTSQALMVLFPIPCPLEIAWRMGRTAVHVEAALAYFAPDILEQLALPCVGPVWSAEIPSGDLSCRIKHLKRWPRLVTKICQSYWKSLN